MNDNFSNITSWGGIVSCVTHYCTKLAVDCQLSTWSGFQNSHILFTNNFTGSRNVKKELEFMILAEYNNITYSWICKIAYLEQEDMIPISSYKLGTH